jgi:hypothetical protein
LHGRQQLNRRGRAELHTMLMRAGLVLLATIPRLGALRSALATPPRRSRYARAAVRLGLASDDDLFASLRARVDKSSEEKGLRPLGPDEVGADCMGPTDVIDYVMNAMLQQRWEILLGFAAAVEGAPEDFLGQVQPGAFSSPEGLTAFLKKEERYRVLLEITEWKPMGTCDLSNLSREGSQKLLVRPESGNWEELYMKLVLVPHLEYSKRWIVTSIYKSGTGDTRG